MMRPVSIVMLLMILASPAGAQDADARWHPFLGCWSPVEGGADVCLAPGAAGSVTVTTRVAGEPVFEQPVVADGAPRPLGEAGCAGSQQVAWSSDGRKLFGRAELKCPSQPDRTVTSVTFVTGDSGRLEVEGVESAGRTSVRIRRYRRADSAPGNRGGGWPLGGAVWTIDDVKEANARIFPEVLETALAETGSRFALTARELVNLADAGVPEAVIDLMIAMSYPEKFQVERQPGTAFDLPSFTSSSEPWGGYWVLGYPYLFSYPGYYALNRNYYSPFGYGYSYVDPRSGIATGSGVDAGSSSSTGGGRVVDGVGYTRIRTREAIPRTDSRGGAAPQSSGRRATVTSSGATQQAGSPAASSGGSSTGSGSSSNGSGSSDNERTAQPR